MVGAGAVAAVIIVAAVIWWMVGAGVSEDQQVGIAACEELAVAEGLPPIARGDVKGPEDGVVDVSWEFSDGTFGGCQVEVIDGVSGAPVLVGDVAASPSPSPSA